MQKKSDEYLLDQEDGAEVARLLDQEIMLNRALGTLLGIYENELPLNSKIIDLACGTGRWATDIAFEFPDAEVLGLDISKTMMQYAAATAKSMKLNNAFFNEADIRNPIDFSDETFDIVNARLLIGALKAHRWEDLLKETYRILKKGGIVRLTEIYDLGTTTSKSYEDIVQIVYKVTKRLGYGFSVSGNNFAAHLALPAMLKSIGFNEVMLTVKHIDFNPGSSNYQTMLDELAVSMIMIPPIIASTGIMSKEDVTKLYQMAQIEFLQEDFLGQWSFVTITGRK